MRIVYTLPARKDMKRLPRDLSERIRSKVNQFASDPGSLANNVVAMKGDVTLRLRVGDWRVIIEATQSEIIVHRVAPRGSVYR